MPVAHGPYIAHSFRRLTCSVGLRKYKEKASRFSAGMNPTLPAQATVGVGNGYF